MLVEIPPTPHSTSDWTPTAAAKLTLVRDWDKNKQKTRTWNLEKDIALILDTRLFHVKVCIFRKFKDIRVFIANLWLRVFYEASSEPQEMLQEKMKTL